MNKVAIRRHGGRRFRVKARTARAGVLLAIVGGCLLATLAGFHFLPPLAALEGGLSDRLLAASRRAPEQQHPNVSIIVINEGVLARLPYRSPVDRGFLADLLLAIRGAGVRGVGFDILFDQATEPAKDARLAQAIRDFPAPVAVAWADARAGMQESQLAWLKQFIEASGARRGAAGLVLDRDGVVRRHRLRDPEAGVVSLPAALVGEEGTGDGARAERIDWLGRTADGKTPFQTLPANGLLAMAKQPAILKRWLKDRFVLIGADLPQQDRHVTALSADPTLPATTAGVVVHAHVVAQMLDDRRIRAAGPATLAALLGLAGLLGAAIGFSGRPLWLQATAGLGLVVAWGAGAIHLAGAYAILAPTTPFLVCFLLAFMLSTSLEALGQRREKAFIRNAFSRYVAPDLVDALTADPDRLELGGERRTIGFIFTDIAGFTTMSERLPPEELTRILNAYLDGMSQIVIAHGGTLDKFIGDAVVALFGAPVTQRDSAARAVRCALALDRFAEAYRVEHAEQGLGVTRIGVHYGEATVGNFGGEERFDYTAMGDAMNTAARLEGANKAFGTRVALSGDVLRAAEGVSDVPMQRIGGVILKGRQAAVEVYTPAGNAPAALLAEYHQALALMDAAPIDAAATLAKLKRSAPDDPLVAFHLARAEAGESGSTFELKEK